MLEILRHLKRFFVSVLKLACGIALAGLLIGLAIWGYTSYREATEQRANAPLADLKQWRQIEVEALENSTFHLQSVWRDGRVYYQFDSDGYPLKSGARPESSSASFTLTFLDKDGFKLFEQNIPLSELTQAVGKQGEPAGLSWKDDKYIDADLYRRATDWELSWSNLSASAPPKAPTANPRPTPAKSPAKWRNNTVWRSLTRGISKEEVRQILGDPGRISELGFQTTWYYGYPLGGDVTFDRNGKVESWSEP